LTRCYKCHKGLNSNYIRVGSKESFKKVGLYCITCDIYYSPNLLQQYTVLQKEYTNLTPTHQSHENQSSIITVLNPSNNFNKDNEKIQKLYGPGRIRTNDPRHVKAVS
jgi:hypothetical protein